MSGCQLLLAAEVSGTALAAASHCQPAGQGRAGWGQLAAAGAAGQQWLSSQWLLPCSGSQVAAEAGAALLAEALTSFDERGGAC